MMRPRVLHGLKMAQAARAEALRLEVHPVRPDDILNPGRIWYAEEQDYIGFSKHKSGFLLPERLLDAEPKWRDLTAPITSNSGVGISSPNWEVFYGDFSAMLFLKNKVQSIQVCFHMDHDYALGTDIFPHVHWMPKTPYEAGTVRWGIEIILAQGHQQDGFNRPPETIYIEQAAADGILNPHMVAESAVGYYDDRLEPDTLIYCRVFRDSGHPNDTAGDVFGLTVDMHIQIDDIGTPSKAPDFYRRD